MTSIDELINSEGTDRVREEKNVRRRVYDAMNVLIAAGVLERNGRYVSWKEDWQTVESDTQTNELDRLRTTVEAKREAVRAMLNRLVAVRHLIDRNAEDAPGKPALSMPFLFLATEDSPQNSMSILSSARGNSLKLKCCKRLYFVEDFQVLLALDLHKLSHNQLCAYLPSADLLKYML